MIDYENVRGLEWPTDKEGVAIEVSKRMEKQAVADFFGIEIHEAHWLINAAQATWYWRGDKEWVSADGMMQVKSFIESDAYESSMS